MWQRVATNQIMNIDTGAIGTLFAQSDEVAVTMGGYPEDRSYEARGQVAADLWDVLEALADADTEAALTSAEGVACGCKAEAWPYGVKPTIEPIRPERPASLSPLLEFNANVSETSPVVKGTWVTVSLVVFLVVDGWSWSDILRAHPEITEDDLRACLEYTVERDAEPIRDDFASSVTRATDSDFSRDWNPPGATS